MAGADQAKGQPMPSAGKLSFYTAVYRLVGRIPPGMVATYGQIARLLGHPSAARAVGYALHALPTGSNIPWQRVINAAGRISSRCQPHAESIQRTLLEAEGVRFNAAAAVDLRRYRWPGPSPDEVSRDREANDQQGDIANTAMLKPAGKRDQGSGFIPPLRR
jgi:methylated-DNA-protein-cysteine methyltransferase-like protein